MATVAAAPPRGFGVAARLVVAKVAGRAYAIAKAGAASALGVAGLASITVAAGMLALPAGFAVGGILAVWLASLLPDSKPGGKR